MPLPVAPQRAATLAGAAPDTSGLTPRELEVLRLLAEGRSKAQIAEALFISPRTASTHLVNIFAKLDVDSRAAAVARSFELGLT